MAAPRKYDYPPTEYSKAIDSLGWSQVHAADMLGLDPRTSRRYFSGDLTMPVPLAMLLRLLVYLRKPDDWIQKVTKP